MPELFGLSAVLFDALSCDDSPHDWESCPGVESLRKEAELLNFRDSSRCFEGGAEGAIEDGNGCFGHVKVDPF